MLGSFRYILQFTFPYCQYCPSSFFQQRYVLDIAGLIAFKFCQPIILVGGRNTNPVTVLMAVPKTSINKYDFLTRRENQVGFAGQVRAV